MRELHGVTVIGKYGYSHWTGKPVTPGCHEVAYVPQSVVDGWEAYCSCGEWYAFVGGFDPEAETKESTIAALTRGFYRHVRSRAHAGLP